MCFGPSPPCSAEFEADGLSDDTVLLELDARMVCTRCGLIGADVGPNWSQQTGGRGAGMTAAVIVVTFLVELGFRRGTPGPNQLGPEPPRRSSGVDGGLLEGRAWPAVTRNTQCPISGVSAGQRHEFRTRRETTSGTPCLGWVFLTSIAQQARLPERVTRIRFLFGSGIAAVLLVEYDVAVAEERRRALPWRKRYNWPGLTLFAVMAGALLWAKLQ